MVDATLSKEKAPLLAAKKKARDDLQNGRETHVLESLTRQLVQLHEQEATEAARLEVVRAKENDLRKAAEVTQEKIEAQKAKMTSMNVAKEKQLLLRKEQLQQAEAAIKKVTQSMVEMDQIYQRGVTSMRTEIRDQQRIVGILRASANVAELMKTQTFDHPPPGPKCLWWVSSRRWHIFSGIIIVLNMVAMFVKFTNLDKTYSYLGVLFLLFYWVELVLKLIYYQDTFLKGPWHLVCWRYLDIFLVITGSIELLMHTIHFGQATATGFGCLRLIRVSRLLRVVRVVRMFFESDLTWTQGSGFQSAMIILILLNCVTMGIESQFGHIGLFLYLENLFLIIFVFELAVRIKLDGCNFFMPYSWRELAWNWLDMFIVCSWAVDFWGVKTIIAIQELSGHEPMRHIRFGQVAAILRTARLGRVLRIVQAVRHIPPLYTLVVGIAEAMQGMGWVMMLTCGVLYCCALVAVRVTEYDWEFYQTMDWEDRQLVKETFSSIPQAAFNLFQVMNADLSGVEHLMERVPASRFVIMVYMIVTNWAIFSILTAVVCDNMLLVTERSEASKRAHTQKVFQERRAVHIKDLFQRLDRDGSNSLNVAEFQQLLNDDVQVEELCSYTGLTKADLEEIFELLSTRRAGEADETVTCEQFMRLLVLESTEATTRVMMKINKRASRIADFLSDHGLQRR